MASPAYGSPRDLVGLSEIYRGRHSVVWNCTCKFTNKPVVLKGYVKAKMQPRHYAQVQREIDLMQQMKFSRVVSFLGTFEDAHIIYIVQENCSKGDLFKRLMSAGGILPERVVVSEIILPLIHALDYLHCIDIIHRDIKPENIFFGDDGGLRLGDFGLSINRIQERAKSRVGTLDYMAPEVISLPSHDQRKKFEAEGKMQAEIAYYGSSVDIWAVGILAYELLVGKPPFEEPDEKDTALRIIYSDEISFPCYISPRAQDFIRKVLKKKPADRPTAKELVQHEWLKPYLQQFIDLCPAGSTSLFKSSRALRKTATFNEQALVISACGSKESTPLMKEDAMNAIDLPPNLPGSVDDDSSSLTTKSKLRRNLTFVSAPKALTNQFFPSVEAASASVELPPAKAVASSTPGPLSKLVGAGIRRGIRRNVTMGAHEVNKSLAGDVVLAVEDMDKLRKLRLGDAEQNSGPARPTSIKGRIISYLQGHGA
mmetsp:Transcript_28937/g.81497  ORF Transcript_28937/g.81497 Transcript_28937/m.81497 type:complete len:483 (+) Transcript_28937:151-1599(+)|eukprot:CAMPEP_0117684690 /NCGR_PEP_ID=MMETSP0804-20121206/21259_1 /TAXON_ID=1074897 /ORGANISM="Tetraselmis astigmatica, Strain CCMP880" /LENGTH=482 /DNA_ID=CAMNT_0005495749 /DNA_START=235 /DNA_END=1683 /DNA_ORIENTATION=-